MRRNGADNALYILLSVNDNGLCREKSAVYAADISHLDEALIGYLGNVEAYLVDMRVKYK